MASFVSLACKTDFSFLVLAPSVAPPDDSTWFSVDSSLVGGNGAGIWLFTVVNASSPLDFS